MIDKVELTENQQELIFDYITKYIKNNGDVGVRESSEYILNIDGIEYKVSMSIFDKDKLFGIIVINRNLNTFALAAVHQLNINKQIENNIKYLTNFMLSKSVSKIVDDEFFSKLTNIDSDKQISRYKKITKILKKIF